MCADQVFEMRFAAKQMENQVPVSMNCCLSSRHPAPRVRTVPLARHTRGVYDMGAHTLITITPPKTKIGRQNVETRKWSR